MPDGFTDAHERRSEKSSSSHEGVSPCLDSMPKNLSAIDCGLLASKPSPRVTSSSAMNSGDAMANVQQMRWGTARGGGRRRERFCTLPASDCDGANEVCMRDLGVTLHVPKNTCALCANASFSVLNTSWAGGRCCVSLPSINQLS